MHDMFAAAGVEERGGKRKGDASCCCCLLPPPYYDLDERERERASAQHRCIDFQAACAPPPHILPSLS